MFPASGKSPYNGEKRLSDKSFVNQIGKIVYCCMLLIYGFMLFVKTGAIFIKKQDYFVLWK